MRTPAVMPATQVSGLVHMTQRDPLETRRQVGSGCSTIVPSLSVLRARVTSLAAPDSAKRKLEPAPLFVVAGSSEQLRSHPDNGAAFTSDAFWRFVRADRVLREALKQAVRWQMLAVNPADAVKPPRAGHKEMQVLDQTGTAQLLRSLQGTRFHLAAQLAVGTGMRRGELLGLRWQDIDLKTGKLAVSQKVRFHDLRHTHTTLLLRQGVHPKVVTERLGHATINITLDTYSHVMPDMQDEAAENLDGALKAAMGAASRRPS